MRKKVSIIAVTFLIVAAILLGLLLLNKGDGPVMGMILSDQEITSLNEYDRMETSSNTDLFLVLSKEFNKYKEKSKKSIPSGKELYASFQIAESLKGTKFKVKWMNNGTPAKEEEKELTTNQKGVISFMLESNKMVSGSWRIELFRDKKKVFEYEFEIE